MSWVLQPFWSPRWRIVAARFISGCDMIPDTSTWYPFIDIRVNLSAGSEERSNLPATIPKVCHRFKIQNRFDDSENTFAKKPWYIYIYTYNYICIYCLPGERYDIVWPLTRFFPFAPFAEISDLVVVESPRFSGHRCPKFPLAGWWIEGLKSATIASGNQTWLAGQWTIHQWFSY